MATAMELREDQVQIDLRADAAVAAAQVKLSDVAILHARSLPLIQRLLSLPLGRAPAAGQEGVVRREAIARWVRSQSSLRDDQLLWGGSHETRVRLRMQELSGVRLQQVAEGALREWLAAHTSRFAVQARPLGGLKLPAGEIELQVRPFADNTQPLPQMLLWVDVHVDKRFVRAVPVSFRVDAYRQGWVAAGRVAAGVTLTPNMMQRREVKAVAEFTGGAERSGLSAPNAAWRTTRLLAKDEAITSRNTALAPVVARGEWVLLYLKSGQVELEGRAQVMQDGDLGQIVQVRSSGGSAPIAARVIAAGQVEAGL